MGRSAAERKKGQTAEAIAERARNGSLQKAKQAARLAVDIEAVNSRKTALGQNPSRQAKRAVEQARTKVKWRELRLLNRDDEAVLAALKRRERLSGIVPADHSGEGDELLWFIADELDLLPVLEKLAPPPTRKNEETGEEIQRREMYSSVVLNILSVLCWFLGQSRNPDIQAAVFCDEYWMSFLGFNAQEVEQGSTQRSQSLAGKTRDGAGGKFVEADEQGPVRAKVEGPRGALSSQTLSGHESDLEPEALLTTFNAVVQALAAKGCFPKKVRTSLDSTGEEVVPSFADAGRVRKKVKVQTKARRPRQVEVQVRGYKLWFVMDVETGLPLSMKMDRIETSETTPAKELIEQAEANLKGHATITSCAVDRGFLDGDFLWWLKEDRGIDWVCPSKENMHVTQEARERVGKAVAALRQGTETPIQTAIRAAREGLSHGKVWFFEKKVANHRHTAVVAQVDELWDTEFYGEGGSKSSRVHSKSYQPTALHGTVVLRWPDRAPKDTEDAAEHDPDSTKSKEPIVLLSPIPEPGLIRLNRYDERSEIENRMNRDGKQYFGLGDTLARNRKALYSATVFSTLALMFYRAMELHREKMQEHLDKRGERLGVLRYRRQVWLQNRGRIIVIVGGTYGMLTLREFATIAGFELA